MHLIVEHTHHTTVMIRMTKAPGHGKLSSSLSAVAMNGQASENMAIRAMLKLIVVFIFVHFVIGQRREGSLVALGKTHLNMNLN